METKREIPETGGLLSKARILGYQGIMREIGSIASSEMMLIYVSSSSPAQESLAWICLVSGIEQMQMDNNGLQACCVRSHDKGFGEGF